jgi:hypothetical protein
MRHEDKDQARSFEERLWPYYVEAFEILRGRQKHYGPANILAAGVWGTLEQTVNKVERARAQLDGEIEAGKIRLSEMDSKTEAVFRDSLMDLINYAAIALALWDGEWTAGMKMEPDSVVRNVR